MPLGVDLIEHGGQRGGLTGTRRAGHQDESARLVTQFGNNVGQVQLLECLDLKRNYAVNSAHRAALIEAVTTETGQTFESEREVELQRLFKAMLLRVSQYAIRQLLGL